MDEKQLEKINGNIEEIWHKLENIDYHLMQISEYGFFSSDFEEAIIAIARVQSKDFDKKYKDRYE